MEAVAFFSEYKPLFAITHVLVVVIGMGAALSADFLSFRYGFNKTLSSMEIGTIRFLARIVTFALLAIVCTGSFLFLSDPAKYAVSVKFLTKMTVVSVLCVNGFLLHHFVFARLGERGVLIKGGARTLRRFAFGLGAVSLASWVSALSLGVLLHIPFSYETSLFLYITLLAFAITVSQVVEWFLLERRTTSARNK